MMDLMSSNIYPCQKPSHSRPRQRLLLSMCNKKNLYFFLNCGTLLHLVCRTLRFTGVSIEPLFTISEFRSQQAFENLYTGSFPIDILQQNRVKRTHQHFLLICVGPVIILRLTKGSVKNGISKYSFERVEMTLLKQSEQTLCSGILFFEVYHNLLLSV